MKLFEDNVCWRVHEALNRVLEVNTQQVKLYPFLDETIDSKQPLGSARVRYSRSKENENQYSVKTFNDLCFSRTNSVPFS